MRCAVISVNRSLIMLAASWVLIPAVALHAGGDVTPPVSARPSPSSWRGSSEVLRGSARTHEGSAFGGEDSGEGLALYEQSGALRVLREPRGSGQPGAAARLPAVGVTLAAQPAYAVEANTP